MLLVRAIFALLLTVATAANLGAAESKDRVAAATPAGTPASVAATTPSSAADYLALGQSAAQGLTNLELDRPLGREVAEQILGGLTLDCADELHLVLDALGVSFSPGVTRVPAAHLLQALRLKGFALGDQARTLLALSADTLPQDTRALEREALVLAGCRTSINAAIGLADDTMYGVVALAQLVLDAIQSVEVLTGRVGAVPGLARPAHAIRRAIVNRLVRVVFSCVALATMSTPNPLRTRLRAAAAVLVAVFLQVDAYRAGQHAGDAPSEGPIAENPFTPGAGGFLDPGAGPGLGGDADHPGNALLWPSPIHAARLIPQIDPPALALFAARWIGKAYLIGSPRRGALPRLQTGLDTADALITRQDITGESARAAGLVLHAPAGSPAPSILDALTAEAARRSLSAAKERIASNFFAAASDIATTVSTIDPTRVSKVIAIVTRVVQEGLVLHAIDVTGSMLHTIPSWMDRVVATALYPDRAVATALHHDRAGPTPARAAIAADNSDRLAPIAASDLDERGRSLACQESRALESTLDDLVDGRSSPLDPDRVAAVVERMETASDALVAHAGEGERTLAGVAEAAGASPVQWTAPAGGAGAYFTTDSGSIEATDRSGRTVSHDLAACALLADLLTAMHQPKGPVGIRDLLARVDAVRQSALPLSVPCSRPEGKGLLGAGPELAIHACGALDSGSDLAVAAEVENTGDVQLSGMELALGLPAGLAALDPIVQELPDLAPGQRASVTIRLAVRGPSFPRASILIRASAACGLETFHTIWLRP